MKQPVFRVLAILTVFALCLPCANAMIIESEQLFEEALYIQSASCPAGYIEYVNNNIGRFLAGTDPTELPETGTITVGQPFCSKMQIQIFFIFLFSVIMKSSFCSEFGKDLTLNIMESSVST